MTDNTTDPTREAIAKVIGKRVSWPSLHWGDLRSRDAHSAIADAILASGLVVTTAEADRRVREVTAMTYPISHGHRWPCPLFYNGNWRTLAPGSKPQEVPDRSANCTCHVAFALPITDPEQEQK